MNKSHKHTSIFDPVLCEIMYLWFSEEGDSVLDPFAGGSVRGIVASIMKRKYTGIELRPEQIKANKKQAQKIFTEPPRPKWIQGDSDKALPQLKGKFDMIFSCPPYGNLEVYSNLEGELSNMPHKDFSRAYQSIIIQAVRKLKTKSFAIFVVGEYRNKTGGYVGFVFDTVQAFLKAGCVYYNEIILYTSLGTAAYRANRLMKNKKVCKVHQNILVFQKEAE